jgi:phage protein D
MAKPENDAPLVPAFDVLVNGKSFAMSFAAHVRSLAVEDDLTQPGMFSLELMGGRLDDGRIAPGGAVEVKLGYVNALDSVFQGEIVAIEAEFLSGGPPLLRLRGYDARQKLLRGRNTRTFTASSDSDIVAQIGRAAGLSIATEDSQIVHDYVVQADQTDLGFVLARAALIGFELVARDGKLSFRPAAFDGGDALTLDVAADLIEFFTSLSLAQQVTGVALRGWSVKDKAVLLANAASGDERATMGDTSSARMVSKVYGGDAADLMGNAPAANQPEADAHARARFNDASLALVTAEGLSLGRTDLRAGTVVRIAGAGTMFSGAYYVTSVQHRYGQRDGYTTRFAARRNAA